MKVVKCREDVRRCQEALLAITAQIGSLTEREKDKTMMKNSNEEYYQVYFINVYSKLSYKRISVEDTHKFSVLLTRKSDCVIIDKDHGLDFLNVEIVIEIKLQ
ncbi:6278_t:CDS:2 [Funneliformis caledonium]|uniref:6278_t:CDS:1 n=1 Tax=Funneliformis caledonium TaxID=1117310 RepID=A0A9N8ZE35_9GLOM|nr:6278_t:CDS:2 [Funneliformis caledonium]